MHVEIEIQENTSYLKLSIFNVVNCSLLIVNYSSMIKGKNAGSVQKQNNSLASTQQHLQIAEIRDNTVVLKDGSLRSVLRISSVNFDLKSEQEQNSLIYSFQGFLNLLEFPVQILVRSKKLDIDSYIEKLIGMAESQQNPLLKNQTYDYIDFIRKLVDLADIMKKEFYVIVPNDALDLTEAISPLKKLFSFGSKDSKASYQKRQREFSSLKKGLDQRKQTISNGIEGMGLTANELTTPELIKLFYESYNPITAELQKFTDLQDINIDREEEVKTN